MTPLRWWMYALLSALCAALIPVLGKLGLRTLPTDVATVLRSFGMSAVLVVFAAATGAWPSLGALREGGTRAVLLVALTGLAGALSWIFYFKALSVGEASRVAPLDKLSVPLAVIFAAVLLGERPSAINWLGVVLVAVGALLASR